MSIHTLSYKMTNWLIRVNKYAFDNRAYLTKISTKDINKLCNNKSGSRIFIIILFIISFVSTEMNTGRFGIVRKLKFLFKNKIKTYQRNFVPDQGSQNKLLVTKFEVKNNRFIWIVFLCYTKCNLRNNQQAI